VRCVRIVLLVAVVIPLLVLPIGTASFLLALFLALDCAAALLVLRPAEAADESVVALDGDTANLALLRRTVPALRMRRPAATVEAQVLWRHAAERHSRRRSGLRSRPG